ncbi:MAG: hypothetical protein Q9207_006913 [Kuettlingeria erythrocarpa]
MVESRKTVLITGCSPGGIGNALAREFHSRGLQVLATARKAENIQDLADLGIVTLSLEVISEQSVNACKDEVAKRTGGGLDYLVNNAGISKCITFMAEKTGVLTDTQTTPSQPSKSNSRKLNRAALRVEVAPLGVHVITVVTGGVKSRIARHQRRLAENSAYKHIEEAYVERQTHSQKVGMEANVYAQVVVSQILHAEGWLWRTRTIWAGGMAGTGKWLSWVLPEAISEWVISRMFGFNKLMKT